MTVSNQTNSFVDTGLARALAFVVAVAAAFLLWTNWSSDFKSLFAGGDQAVPVVSASEPAKPVNQELEKCLVQRVGDVDRMKADGILSEAQYGSFRTRAEELCRAQNPGS